MRANDGTNERLRRRNPTTSPPRLQQFNTAASASARYDPAPLAETSPRCPACCLGGETAEPIVYPLRTKSAPPLTSIGGCGLGTGRERCASEGRLIGDRRESPPFCHVPEPDVRKVRPSVKVRPIVGVGVGSLNCVFLVLHLPFEG